MSRWKMRKMEAERTRFSFSDHSTMCSQCPTDIDDLKEKVTVAFCKLHWEAE